MSKTIAISKPTTRGNYLKKKSPPPLLPASSNLICT